PPYDIISGEMQDQLYEKNDHNFVRLILNKTNPADTDEDNRYTRAKELFGKWKNEGFLKPSDKPAIFPYKITYKHDNETKTMNGFFTLLKLDPDYKLVKAHEQTLSKPKADRLNLMRACHANLEPIQLLYIDKNDEIREKIDSLINKPIINVNGYDGFDHKLWKIEDENVISMISKKLDNEILFIADGHHRYQTAINYANEIKEKTGNTGENAPFNYRMVILANIFDEGLSILPTHRFIKMPDLNMNNLLEKLQKYFAVEEKPIDLSSGNFDSVGKKIMDAIQTVDEHKFALYSKTGKYYILTLKDEKIMDKLAAERSKTWRTLDVSILHKIILEKILGVDEDNLEDHVKYTRVNGEAIKFVENEKFDISFLMNATKIEELKAIADAGEHMPQKSTYFLPKMLSGLVMYKM
ncbi:MAG: DUF1015 domain-containing protein, partial [Candidatus Thermoplasmatota archaeon]|nr:DUF1015 domain-containing protein [Candidatus Thermoplasmatota archaeon]